MLLGVSPSGLQVISSYVWMHLLPGWESKVARCDCRLFLFFNQDTHLSVPYKELRNLNVLAFFFFFILTTSMLAS